ncbi:MAG: cupin [Pseudomonadota bacterium]
MRGIKLAEHPVHLGLGAGADSEPQFTGDMSWYEGYSARHTDDGPDGRLVSLHSFSESWGMWEMHPLGAEVVVCTSGSMTLIQQNTDGSVLSTHLAQGEYAINAPGVWHTADVAEHATALFITAGMGTEHRPRDKQ